jgi:hypothetical protein
MKNDSDFIAVLQYRTMEEGGRKTPVKSGYRPDLRFPFSEKQTSGLQTFIGKEFVMPGEQVEAEIKIIGDEHFAERLYEGLEFDFREGDRIIGTGKITRILNEKLRNNSDDLPAITTEAFEYATKSDDVKRFKIRKTAGMSVNQLYNEVSIGGRIVIYGYCISIIVLTFRLVSSPYYIKPGEKASKYRGKYSLLSLLMGWWGLPWGPIYTLEMLKINSNKQGGATDVTEDVLLKLQEKYTSEEAKKIADKDITIEYAKGSGTSGKNPRSWVDGYRQG